jgi:hypothetical protein
MHFRIRNHLLGEEKTQSPKKEGRPGRSGRNVLALGALTQISKLEPQIPLISQILQRLV